MDDVINSYFEPVNAQVETACRQIADDPRLASGYYAVGFSQASLDLPSGRLPDPPVSFPFRREASFFARWPNGVPVRP